MRIIQGIGDLSPSSLLGIVWTGIGVAIIFTLVRTAIRLHVFRRLYADDACVYFALVLLLLTGVLTTRIIPIMFEFEYILHGQKGVTAGFVQRVNFFLRTQFAIIALFWTSIWAVKFSFLVWYRKVLVVPSNRMILWWGVSTFTFLAYIGCWITQLESCRPISNYFLLGGCQSKRDIFVSNVSLYYSTAADIACDLLIMIIPLRLLWGLQVNRRQKLALTVIFSLAFIIIVFAIVRVIQISPSSEHVDPIWLALWSMIEGSIAVIVACLPSFQVLLTARSPSAFLRRKNVSSGFQQQESSLGMRNFASRSTAMDEEIPTNSERV